MDVTKPNEFIKFGAMDVTKPYELPLTVTSKIDIFDDSLIPTHSNYVHNSPCGENAAKIFFCS